MPNPFDAFKKFADMDEDFAEDVSNAGWPPDPVEIINRLGQAKWPNTDILETETELIILIDLPGLQKSSALLEVNGMTLKVEGELSFLTGPVCKVHRQERKTGKFTRTVALPAVVRNTDICAIYRGGILEVRLLKLMEKPAGGIPIDFRE